MLVLWSFNLVARVQPLQVLRYYHDKDKADWLQDFRTCGTTPIRSEFMSKWTSLTNKFTSEKAKRFFSNARPQHWANAIYTGPRWGQMTNNIAESFNSWVLDERDLPGVAMVNGIRVKVMALMNRRREQSLSVNTLLCAKHEEKLKKNFNEGRTYYVTASSALKYEVWTGQAVYTVNLEQPNPSCSCQVWRVTGIPCSHACTAITRARLSLYDFCDQYYRANRYKQSYSFSINPVPGQYEPYVPVEETNEVTIRPPATKAPPGRRKKRRIPSQSSDRVVRKLACSRCGAAGHNRRTCKNAI